MTSRQCPFCHSYSTLVEEDHVVRCKTCWRMHFDSDAKMEHDETYWMYCSHEFVDTGTKISWCKHCNIDASFSFNHGGYVSNDDLKSLSGNSETYSEGDT